MMQQVWSKKEYTHNGFKSIEEQTDPHDVILSDTQTIERGKSL
ncbi:MULTISPECIES: hypothetical protein [unclassified Granulicatella]|nr:MULTISPECIES: hypothetical protein [unclassified Granulicatella]